LQRAIEIDPENKFFELSVESITQPALAENAERHERPLSIGRLRLV
jgi:hypothetical protein